MSVLIYLSISLKHEKRNSETCVSAFSFDLKSKRDL